MKLLTMVFGRTDYNAYKFVNSFYVSGREYLKKVGVNVEIDHELVGVKMNDGTMQTPFITEYKYNVRGVNDLEYVLKMYENFKNGKSLLSGIAEIQFLDTLKYIDKKFDTEVDYDYLAISSYDTFIFYELYTLFTIKRKNPNIKTVIGGNTIINSEYIGRFLAELDGVDYVISGDFENSMEMLLTGKLNEGFSIVKPIDLKLLAPPIHTAEDSIRCGGYITIAPSRACVHNCIFCSTAGLKTFRYVPTEQFIEWIRLNQEIAVAHSLTFNAPTTNWSEKQFEDMLDGLISINNKFRITAWFRIEKLNENLIAKMKKANFIVAYIGIDGVCNELRERMNKGKVKLNKILENLELLQKYDLDVSVGMIRYFPGITPKENYMELLYYKSIKEKFPKLRIYNYHYIMMSGSPMERYPEKFGLTVEYWSNPNPNLPELDNVISKIKKSYNHDWSNVIKYEEWEDTYVTRPSEFEKLKMGYIPDTELGRKYKKLVGEL
jgi:radical SAM superfamily enzyme YgiQ (UPF0313 family)